MKKRAHDRKPKQSNETRFTESVPAEVIPSGIGQIDRQTGGIPVGEVTIFACPDANSSRNALLGIALSIANSGRKVLYTSPLANRAEVFERTIAWIAKIPHSKLASGDLSDDEITRITDATHTMMDIPFSYSHKTITPSELRTVVNRELIEAIVINSLNTEIETITQFKRLAHDLDVAVLLNSNLEQITSTQDLDSRNLSPFGQQIIQQCELVLSLDMPLIAGVSPLVKILRREDPVSRLRLTYNHESGFLENNHSQKIYDARNP